MTLAASGYDKMREAVLNVVSGHFRPEFINRIDELVVFEPLDRQQVQAIASIQIGILNRRLAERELLLEVSDEAMSRLADVGFDPVYGARPLKRAIQQRFENPLAQRILKGEFSPGQTIVATVDGENIVFATPRLQ
jgi:ATP-dependent Clp protease ATP-binding subunit ClpB